MSAGLYAACRAKHRATRAEMDARLGAIARIVSLIHPCSVRQAFYQAEVKGVVEKTENGYEKAQRAIVWLRQHRFIPFNWISDATRWMRKPTSFDSIEAALQETVRTYRRAVWRDAAKRRFARAVRRSKTWKGDSVELDAIPPNQLRQLVHQAIERFITPERLAVIEAVEASEREGAKIFLRQRQIGGAP
jgi:hypothetical protein